MITGIDHIALQVRDFERTVAGYEVIFGRKPNWRGGATGWRHAWFQFENAAVDIVAADGDSPAADNIRADIEKHGEGVWGVGFAVPVMDDAVKLLTRRGLEFLPAHTTMSQNAQGQERRWQIAMMKRKSGNGVSLFLVEQAKERWPVPEAKFGDASVQSRSRRGADDRCRTGGGAVRPRPAARQDQRTMGRAASAPATRWWRSAPA